MRALILSDIHANLDALDAVLAAAPAHDAVWNLGDVAGYGAAPNEVIARVQPLGKVFVRGNHDRAASGLSSVEYFNPIAAQAALWTRKTLTQENLEWLRQLPEGPVSPGAPDVCCVHGSPLDEDQYILSVHDAVLPLRQAQARITFFGHTHVQGGFAASGEEWFKLDPHYAEEDQADVSELPLRPQARYLINPGSVGQPRDRDWRAAFALYDEGRSLIEFHRVPYDVGKAQARILRAGLPDRLAARLREGR